MADIHERNNNPNGRQNGPIDCTIYIHTHLNIKKRGREQKRRKKLCLFYLDADGSATVVSIFIKLVLCFHISFI